MHRHLFFAVGLLVSAAALAGLAQNTPKLEFEVASVKPSPPGNTAEMRSTSHMDGAQFTANYYSLKSYIRMAYRVKEYQVEGPDWIASERYNVVAKLPDGGTRDQIPDMLQSLLQDRFKLAYHKDSKDFSVYGLTAGKNGITAKKVDDGTSAPADAKVPFGVDAQGSVSGVTINIGEGSYFSLLPDRLEIKKLTFPVIADVLSRFVDLPIVDMTNAGGRYDMTFPITREDYRLLLLRSAIAAGVTLPPGVTPPDNAGAGDSLLSGLEQQGLKLEHRKAPLEMIVVDRVERTPSEN